ncbi:MAG: peptidoglycan bridge formation glycyltransferase FemA/FemB family protein, partial [bacterium]
MVKIVAFNNEKDWNKFAFRYSYSYFLQSWDWGEVNLDLANKIYRYGIFKGERLVGIFLAILQKAQRGPLSYQSLIVPAGPLIDYSNSNQVKEVFEFIEQLAKKEGADFVRVRPPILAGPEAVLLFKKSGYKAAPTHLHAEITLQLDLFQSEEELLKQMRKTTRYSIRKAEKDGVTIKVSTDPEDAKIIYHLQEATVGR